MRCRRRPLEGGGAREAQQDGARALGEGQVDTSLIGPDGPLGEDPEGSPPRDDLLLGSASASMPEWLSLS